MQFRPDPTVIGDEPYLAGLQFYFGAGTGTDVQATGQLDCDDVQRAAAQGISGSGTKLPYAEQLQRSFGAHDVSAVQAHVDSNAAAACDSMDALAYATGTHVAFKRAPDLHTVAHEAAHVVQQRAGVQLKGGVGEAGDRYESHADAVADAVVAGKSAEGLLSQMAPLSPSAVQAKEGDAIHYKTEGAKKGGDSSGTTTTDEIKLKRKHINLTGEDKYGHWWTELGAESYGWWPKYPVGLSDTLLGCEGELNGATSFGGTATRDPHHGDSAEEDFSVRITSGKSIPETKEAIRTFANGYSGEWRWTFGSGQNCHTFQEALMRAAGLEKI